MAELYDLLTTDRYKDQVMAVRNAKNQGTKGNLKALLPSYTPAGTFADSSSFGPLELSGFICVDIDKKDNLDVVDFGYLKEVLSQVPYIAYCGLSCGGEGYFCIVPIADVYLFKSHFRSLQIDFAAIGVTIDQACSDIGRKRFVSYDPEPYFNYAPEVYRGLADEKCEHHSQHSTENELVADWYETAQTEIFIKAIEEKKVDITESYPKWFRIGCAFANTFGEDGREKFHRVSQFYYNYDPAETDKLYDSVLKGNSSNPITIKTFLYYARESRANWEH